MQQPAQEQVTSPQTTQAPPGADAGGGFDLRFAVSGMTCAGCVARVERTLAAVPGLSDVAVNLATESASVHVRDGAALREAERALDGIGKGARRQTLRLAIEGMTCGGCVGRAERAIAAVPGVLDVAVNLASESAEVSYLEGATSPSAIAAASTAAGYRARPRAAQDARQRGARKAAEAQALRTRLALAALMTLPVFLLEMGGHVVPAFHHWIAQTIGLDTSWRLQALLSALVLFGPGRGFFVQGLAALRQLAPDMNSLVAVGAGAAWLYSMVATFVPGLLPDGVRAVYFEAAAMIVTLILAGRWLEARARGRTGAAIAALIGLQPSHARRLRKDGQPEDVEVEALAPGDLILLRPGERVALDGEVVEGEAHVDESMLSGEPLPVAKGPGDAVTGGTVVGAGSLAVRITRTGEDTALARIIRMVEDAQGAKLPIQSLVDQVTLRFVPVVMALAVLTVAVWLLVGPEPRLTHALVAGVSVLIIACPCAMGLATPTSIMVGTGRAAELGVLFRRGEALQTLGHLDRIAFDKTGTLTEGRPQLAALMIPGGDEARRAPLLAAIAAAEARSEHPIARALVEAAAQEMLTLPEVTGFRSLPGQGISACVAGQALWVGNARLFKAQGLVIGPELEAEAARRAARGETVLYAALAETAPALIAVADPIKPGAAAAVAELRAAGVEVAMITGDGEATARAIAAELGIDHVVAGVLPEGKVAALSGLRSAGGTLAFVGDGINDAPALAAADVGIALGTGTDVAIEAGDVVLVSGDPRGVLTAMEVSRATLRNIRQNLGWAFAYNAALVPLAAGALYPVWGLLLSPVFAAGAMALSSVSVLSNALRLRRISPARK